MSSRGPSRSHGPLSHGAFTEPKRSGRPGDTPATKVSEDPTSLCPLRRELTNRNARIILDASARRFQSKKIYLRAVAAVRWSNTRTTIRQSGEPLQQQTVLLQQANTNLHAVCTGFSLSCGRTVTDAVSLSPKELAAITDTAIYYDFRQADYQAGYWLHDDPPLASILSWIRSQCA